MFFYYLKSFLVVFQQTSPIMKISNPSEEVEEVLPTALLVLIISIHFVVYFLMIFCDGYRSFFYVYSVVYSMRGRNQGKKASLLSLL